MTRPWLLSRDVGRMFDKLRLGLGCRNNRSAYGVAVKCNGITSLKSARSHYFHLAHNHWP